MFPAHAATAATAWDPFPPPVLNNDFGGIGLLQTPTARFAEDGQVSFSGNRVAPYERYAVTIQATPWLEGSLRYSSVGNRLYSDTPAFSGDQTYKDRGFDIKLLLATEGRYRPALAFGLRDFIGTGLFSSEYFVATKEIGPFDLSLGIGWGNMGTGLSFKNPFRLISSRFDDRGAVTASGGAPSSAYFKGRTAAVFGGVQYRLPVQGLSLVAELDANSYKQEALFNRFRTASPVNVGIDYRPAHWLQFGAGLERGNRLALRLTITGNLAHPTNVPKFDPPAPPLRPSAAPATPADGTQQATAGPLAGAPSGAPASELMPKLTLALAQQGAGLFGARFSGAKVDLYVAQSRFRSMPQGLGRIARAAFSVLPEQYQAVRVVFVESGMTTTAATIYRFALVNALANSERGATEELWLRSAIERAPEFDDIDLRGPADSRKPHLFYSIRPSLRTTLGRPEQFILYSASARLNAALELRRGLLVTGAVSAQISDNFNKLTQGSDSVLPHVRSDIKEYLRQGDYPINYLRADYSFNIAPDVYGHVYGGLLEEMFAGVGGEILYRPFGSNWAFGADLTRVRQRGFDQLFDLREYSAWTGFVTIFRHFPGAEIDLNLRIGQYLAGDRGATLDISRTFRTGVKVGAFATKTNVSAADFGEGRFDKGFYVTIPLDLIFTRNVRSNVGLLFRPLLRDGGQQLEYRFPLIGNTEPSSRYNFARDWRDILK